MRAAVLTPGDNPQVESFDAALVAVLRECHPLPAEAVDLGQALGRVLAERIHADADLPAFDRSAMDGYALHGDDLRTRPPSLREAGTLRAGEWPRGPSRAGLALRIMTGAPVPAGAAAVAPVEDTEAVPGGGVRIRVWPKHGAHVVRQGTEGRAGDIVLLSGRRLDPAAIAVLAAVGCVRPPVARRPRLAILVTGDEIVGAENCPRPAQVRNSNGPALLAAAQEAGAEARLLGVAPDRRPQLDEALAEGFAADVLVVCGGVSMGDYDLVEPALLDAGAHFHFTGVAIRPGAPLVFGRRARTLLFGLPGNPVSTQVTFELFVRPCLLALQGASSPLRRRVTARLQSSLTNRPGRTSFLPARLSLEDGVLAARPLSSRGSGDQVTHAGADALVVLEADRTEVRAGETVGVLLGGFGGEAVFPPTQR